jgi:hypothetical protein
MTLTDNSHTSTIQPCQNVAPSKVKLVIYHRFPGIELISPVYASDGAECRLPLDQRVDFGSIAYACFSIDLIRSESTGILMYKLKNTRQPNRNTISSKDEATCAQLYIAWKVNNSKEFCVVSHLIEHDKGCVWDRDRLMTLAKWYNPCDIHVPIEVTYLMRDNTVLMTRVNVFRETESYKFEMNIYETSIRDDTWRLWYIDVDK